MVDRGELTFPIRIDSTRSRTEIQVVTAQRLVFRFTACGTTVQASGKISPQRLELFLEADVGPLPYSAESRAARAAAIALMRAPPPGRIARLDVVQRIVLGGEIVLEAPLTPIGIVAALTGWMREIQPWLTAIAPPLATAMVDQRRRDELSSAAS
jgi:hypothetical protein